MIKRESIPINHLSVGGENPNLISQLKYCNQLIFKMSGFKLSKFYKLKAILIFEER